MKYKYLVIIIRDGDTTIYPFPDINTAKKFYEKAHVQWSDSYICKIIQGPLT